MFNNSCLLQFSGFVENIISSNSQSGIRMILFDTKETVHHHDGRTLWNQIEYSFSLYDNFPVVHFAVTICHGCEIKTDLCQAISGCVKLLPVPESFHDIEATLPTHRTGCTGQYAGYFFFRETIKELAHPDSIEPCRERYFGIEQIGAIPVNTHCSG